MAQRRHSPELQTALLSGGIVVFWLSWCPSLIVPVAGFLYKLLFPFFVPSVIVQRWANKVKFNLISKLFAKLFLLIVESVPLFPIYNTVIGGFVFNNRVP